MNDDQVLKIAMVCHEANATWCAANGDLSQGSWGSSPQWQRDSVVDGVKFHLANPAAGADASHNEWMRHKLAAGWVYGGVKDPDHLKHPCIVPFDELPEHQQAKDRMFRAIVHALSADTA